MGIDSIIGTLLSILFSLFGFEEDMQITFLSRLLRMTFVFMMASIIYATFINGFKVLSFNEWSITWFQTQEFNDSLKCLIVAYIIFFIIKYAIKRLIIALYIWLRKWGAKKMGGEIQFIRFLISPSTLQEMQNYLLKKKYLKKRGHRTFYTNKGSRIIKTFVKSVNEIELNGYNLRVDLLNVTGFLIGIITSIYYHLTLAIIISSVLFVYVLLKTICYMIISDTTRIFIKAIKFLDIHEPHSNI